MSYKSRNRHYRVAQKTVETAPQRGMFISNNQKNRLLVSCLAVLLVTFLNGILVGHSIFRSR